MVSLLVAGDSFSFSEDLPDYNVIDGWQVRLTVRTTDGQRHEKDLAPSGTVWVHNCTSTESANWAPGLAEWFLTAHKNDTREMIRSGVFRVRPDPQQDYELQHAEKMLQETERVILARVSGDRSERYTIGGQSHDKTPLHELEVMRDKYRREVKTIRARRRRLATGRRSPRTTRTVFTG